MLVFSAAMFLGGYALGPVRDAIRERGPTAAKGGPVEGIAAEPPPPSSQASAKQASSPEQRVSVGAQGTSSTPTLGTSPRVPLAPSAPKLATGPSASSTPTPAPVAAAAPSAPRFAFAPMPPPTRAGSGLASGASSTRARLSSRFSRTLRAEATRRLDTTVRPQRAASHPIVKSSTNRSSRKRASDFTPALASAARAGTYRNLLASGSSSCLGSRRVR